MGSRKPRRSGMRRAYIKRFSGEYINAGKTANSAYLQEAKDRTRSLTKKDITQLEYFEKNLTHANRALYEQQSKIATTSANNAAFLMLKDLWQTDFWQGWEHVHRKNLVMTHDRSLFLFISRKGYFFVSEKRGDGENNLPRGVVIYRRTRMYPTYEFAMMMLEANQLRDQWVDKHTVRKVPRVLLDTVPAR